MDFQSLTSLKKSGILSEGPYCLVLAEDAVEIPSTVAHHLSLGFSKVLLALPKGVTRVKNLSEHCLSFPKEGTLDALLNTLTNALPKGTWLGLVYNAEYLFFPFSDQRNIKEVCTHVEEERRHTIFCHIVDLYAADLTQAQNGVSRERAHFDTSGYYALPRWHMGTKLSRQIQIFGGLRRRFEEHVTWEKRRIDRVSLFRTGLSGSITPDLRFSNPESNTYTSPWHHSLTASICSFRAAKALATNPGSASAIDTFMWPHSEKFSWSSQQLLEHGFMEPGQWF